MEDLTGRGGRKKERVGFCHQTETGTVTLAQHTDTSDDEGDMMLPFGHVGGRDWRNRWIVLLSRFRFC